MIRPVSGLYKSILEFVMSTPQIQNLLKQRESYNNAYMSEVDIKFFRSSDNDNNRAAYTVSFIYNTHYPNPEKNDDIKCYVEVNKAEPDKFKIIKVLLD